MDNDKPDARPTQTEPVPLPPARSLEPPRVLVSVYALASPEDVACARAMRHKDDAFVLYRLLTRADFKTFERRRLCERVAFHWRHGGTGPEELLTELLSHGSSLAALAAKLAALPDWLVDAAGPPEAIASAVKRGPYAFRVPHPATRRSAAA
jgi:hypothetical protein